MVLAGDEALGRADQLDSLIVPVVSILHLINLSTRGERHQLIAHADAVSGELTLEGILYLSYRLLAASWGARTIADEDTTQPLDPVSYTHLYQTVETLHEAIPHHPGDWYFTGDYPTPGGSHLVNDAFIAYYEQQYNRK